MDSAAAAAVTAASTGVPAAVEAMSAAPAGAAVNGSHVVAAIPGSSTLELSGYAPRAGLSIDAIRNGVVIGHATTTVLADGSAGRSSSNSATTAAHDAVRASSSQRCADRA